MNLQVVVAVARVYHHLAPTDEVSIVARSLVRLLRSHRLDCILMLNRSVYTLYCIVDGELLATETEERGSSIIHCVENLLNFFHCFHIYEIECT